MKKARKRHILYFVEGARDKFKSFNTKKGLLEYMDGFRRVYLDEEADNWIQAVIYDVTGEIALYSQDLDLE